MTTVWRIIRKKYQDTLFTGEGARRFGSRWNHTGTPLVYTSDSLSLAILEKMVHLRDYSRLLEDFVAVKATFNEGWIRVCEVEILPPRSHGQTAERRPATLSVRDTELATTLHGDWRSAPPPRETKDLGSRWADGRLSPVLRVPSAVVPTDHNYLINPLHPDFDHIGVGEPRDLPVDPRLVEG